MRVDSGIEDFDMPSRISTGIALVAALLALSTEPVQAQQGSETGVRDYYTAASTPDGARALANLEQFHIAPGLARLKGRNYQGAFEDFTFILASFPNHPQALALVSDVCDVQWKDVRCDADPWFQRAVEINPRIAQTYVLVGLHQQRRGRATEAVRAYQRALELNPASSNAHYNLGLAYFDQKRFDLANQHAQASYALGFPLPGLKDKLSRAGQWKDLPADELKRLISVPAVNAVKAN